MSRRRRRRQRERVTLPPHVLRAREADIDRNLDEWERRMRAILDAAIADDEIVIADASDVEIEIAPMILARARNSMRHRS